MSQQIKTFFKFKPLLIELITRDVKTKYRRSILGVMWTLLNPLLMMVVLSVVFSNLFRFNIENYPLYIMSGQVIFNFFSESTTSAMSSIVDNAPLIKKVYIPKYLFALSRVSSSVINVMASFSALIIVMIFTNTELHFTIFLAFVPIILLIILSVGIGLILATIAVKFRDIIHLYGVLVTALMYLTPVIYPTNQLDSVPVIKFLVFEINPISRIMMIFRDLVMYNTIPSVLDFLICLLIGLVALAIGLHVFYKHQDNFILNI